MTSSAGYMFMSDLKRRNWSPNCLHVKNSLDMRVNRSMFIHLFAIPFAATCGLVLSSKYIEVWKLDQFSKRLQFSSCNNSNTHGRLS